jgi:WD40 repeat protein
VPLGRSTVWGRRRQRANPALVCTGANPLALSCDDGVTRIWDLATSKVKDEFPDFQSPSLAFAPNGAALAGMRQDDLIVWDLPQHTKRFQVHVGSWAGLISFSKDGSLLACKRQERMIKLWDAHDGRTRGIAEGHRAGITALVFSPDSKEIATSSDDGTIKLWNIDQLCAEK